MIVKFDGQELSVKSVELTIEQEKMPDDYFFDITRMPLTFTAQLKLDPTFDITKRMRVPRKLVFHWLNSEQMDAWRHISRKLEINFAGARWKIYRRDYRRNRVHLREVLDN